jgi:glyoxylase-like metal-dependent hydrolase (beta-lactamase superfamily II)
MFEGVQERMPAGGGCQASRPVGEDAGEEEPGMAEVREVGDGVLALHYDFLDQNIGVVVGGERVLVIDTRSAPVQAREVIEDLRRVTPLPWVVLDTHHHWDHVFGNAAFRPAEVWGHERCVARMLERSAAAIEEVGRVIPSLAAELAQVEVSPPDVTVGDEDRARIDLGGRAVEVRYLGRAHTDDDVIAWLPEDGILFAGDLVEEGAPPAFGDAYPLEWPATDGSLVALGAASIVPGHGRVVDEAFVREQMEELSLGAGVMREAHAAGRPVAGAARSLPWPVDPFGSRFAERAYAQLDGVT